MIGCFVVTSISSLRLLVEFLKRKKLSSPLLGRLLSSALFDCIVNCGHVATQLDN